MPEEPRPAPKHYGPQRSLSASFWIFTAVFALRLLVLIRLSYSPWFIPESGDMWFYSSWALRILHGQWTDHHAFYGLPGYAYFLAALFALAGFSPFLAGLLQCASDAFIAVIIYKLSLAVFSSSGRRPADTAAASRPFGELDRFRAPAVGLLAAAGWALFEPAQTFSIIMMPTTWLILAFWGCVLWVLHISKASVYHPWLAMGLLLGMVSMMIATIFFLIPLILAAIVIRVGRGRGIATRSAMAAGAATLLFLGVIAGASPCWLHNYFVAHERVFLSAHSGVNFYIGNNPTATGYPHLPPGMRASQAGMLKDSITVAEEAAGHPISRAEVSRYWSEKAGAYIRANPGAWALLLLTKVRNFWNAYQYDDLSLITHFSDESILVPGIRFGLVATFGLAGLLVAGFLYPRSRWIIAAILLHMASLLSVFVTERYRMAAIPGLLLTGSLCIWELWILLSEARWLPALGIAGGICASACFVSWPTDDPGLWSLDYYNTGVTATEMGQLDRAQQKLELAYAYVPGNSEINFALGNLWLAKGDAFRAKQFYAAALRLNPRHSGAYNNLGVIALQEGLWPTAGDFFQRSLAIEPEDAKTHYLLAQVHEHLGDLVQAGKEIDLALQLRPGQKQFETLREEIDAKMQNHSD